LKNGECAEFELNLKSCEEALACERTSNEDLTSQMKIYKERETLLKMLRWNDNAFLHAITPSAYADSQAEVMYAYLLWSHAMRACMRNVSLSYKCLADSS
jgi:hypothetical protein